MSRKSTKSKNRKRKDFSYLLSENKNNVNNNEKEKSNDSTNEEITTKLNKLTDLNNNLSENFEKEIIDESNIIEYQATAKLINIIDNINKDINFVESLIALKNKYTDRNKKLKNYFLKLQKAIKDIEHTIENCKFNACEGYLYSKMQKDLFIKRRDILFERKENNIMISILDDLIEKFSNGHQINNTCRGIETYNYRILDANKDFKKQINELLNEI